MMTRHMFALAATATLLSSGAAFAQTEMAMVNVDGVMVPVNYALAGEACGMDDQTVQAKVQEMMGGGMTQEGGANLSDPSTADTSTLNQTGQDANAEADMTADVAATTDVTAGSDTSAQLDSSATADTSTLNQTGQDTDAAADLAADRAATTDTAAADTMSTGTAAPSALCTITQARANELGFPSN